MIMHHDLLRRMGMETYSKWNIVITGVGTIIALIEIYFVLYKYHLETKRQKYKDTINIFNNLLEDTYLLKEEYTRSFSGPLFNAENLSADPTLYKQTMTLLTRWEGFSRGLCYHTYDLRTFIYLTPKELADLLILLVDFVIKERSKKNYGRLFLDFTEFANRTTMYVQRKIEGKRIPSKYPSKRSSN